MYFVHSGSAGRWGSTRPFPARNSALTTPRWASERGQRCPTWSRPAPDTPSSLWAQGDHGADAPAPLNPVRKRRGRRDDREQTLSVLEALHTFPAARPATLPDPEGPTGVSTAPRGAAPPAPALPDTPGRPHRSVPGTRTLHTFPPKGPGPRRDPRNRPHSSGQ